MRITIITCPFGLLPPHAIGAVEKLFYLLSGEWANHGNYITFVCAGGGEDSRMKFVRLKKYDRTGSTKKDLFWDFLYSVKALLCMPKTDILLCNTFWTPALAPLVRWKYKKLIYGVHRYPKGQFWLYPFVHAFICVSSVVANALCEQLGEAKLPRVATIINPIDERVFNANRKRDVLKGRILYAGRVHQAKGVLCLAKACSWLFKHGECSELVLVGAHEKEKGGGGDEFVRMLRAAAAPCPVTVIGAIADPRQLADIERTAEVFVYPSEDALGEACPIAPMEAMALGIPTVVSNLKCYDDYVDDGIDALKFKEDDDEDLSDKLRQLILNGQFAKSIAISAVKKIEQFSVPHVAERYLQVFKNLFV